MIYINNVHLYMAKGRYNFRLDDDLIEHIKNLLLEKGRKNLTRYVEAALKKASKFKEQDLV